MTAFDVNLDDLVNSIACQMDQVENRGRVASYIPELSRVSPGKFGVAIVTLDGKVYTAGDSAETFSIQSVSKVFSLTLALGKAGDNLWHSVGREPSGTAFNSIVQLEHEQGRPRNPFINAGAIAVTDVLLAGHQPKETIGEILRFVRFLSGDDSVAIDEAVAQSEMETGHRNMALAAFMASYGKLKNPAAHTLGVYFHQCAIAMNCLQLAKAGLFLAAKGKNPVTGYSMVSAARARRINALMMLCGHYDGSGDFAYRVGLPGKSGVGGGILAIAPGHASIAVWSPGLNANGNSLLGTMALELIARQTGWSVFG